MSNSQYQGQSDPNSYDFSFSGLKTAILYDLVKRDAYNLKNKILTNNSLDLKKKVASSLLTCVADIFEQKFLRAFKEYPNIKALAFVGGVACNKYIKNRLQKMSILNNKLFFTPSAQYCTDNASMISFVGHYKSLKGEFSDYFLDI